MKTALFIHGFKSGFRDVTDRQLGNAAIAGAVVGVAVTCIVFMSKAGL